MMRLDNAVPNASTCRSLELGVIRCIDEILEQVRRNTGLSITETQVERILQGKSCSMPAEVVSLIEKQAGFTLKRYCLRSPRQALICGQFLPFSWERGCYFSAPCKYQDRLCRPIYLTDIHANAAGYERIVGQMRRCEPPGLFLSPKP